MVSCVIYSHNHLIIYILFDYVDTVSFDPQLHYPLICHLTTQIDTCCVSICNTNFHELNLTFSGQDGCAEQGERDQDLHGWWMICYHGFPHASPLFIPKRLNVRCQSCFSIPGSSTYDARLFALTRVKMCWLSKSARNGRQNRPYCRGKAGRPVAVPWKESEASLQVKCATRKLTSWWLQKKQLFWKPINALFKKLYFVKFVTFPTLLALLATARRKHWRNAC